MKIIKSIFYNNCPELITFLILFTTTSYGAFCCIASSFKQHKISFSLFCITTILFSIWELNKSHKNKAYKYFACSYSFFKPNSVWINQRVCKKRNQDVCPKRECAKELNMILQHIPDGTKCYCCTHSLIQKHIQDKYPNARISYAYSKDLKNIKKQTQTKKCKNCNIKSCTISKHEITKFYSICFTKENQ